MRRRYAQAVAQRWRASGSQDRTGLDKEPQTIENEQSRTQAWMPQSKTSRGERSFREEIHQDLTSLHFLSKHKCPSKTVVSISVKANILAILLEELFENSVRVNKLPATRLAALH